jgi:RTX calcium-binding nonapeptide repeat (4 copies)
MPSSGRPAASRAKPFTARSGRGTWTRLPVAAAFAAICTLVVLGGALIANAATPGCVPSQSTSADGTIAYGSACADEIVISSPRVEKVFAGKGDDVIYVQPEVEAIYGGAGDDLIFGDLPEGGLSRRPDQTPEAGIDYEPAPASETAPGGTAGKSGRQGSKGKDQDSKGPLSATSSAPQRGPQATVSETEKCSADPCLGGDGSQDMFGGPGADEIFGQRGNDTLHGEGGYDSLYGGIGDDTINGNDGSDLLAGGLGTDTLDGNNNGDTLRGDGTVDVLRDTGAEGTDVLSFVTGVPGFVGAVSVPGFPPEGPSQERGVYVRMDGADAPCGTPSCNNDARYGGGGDEINVSGFEAVVGTPFSDYYVGSSGNDTFYGGGGADVMIGNGGDNVFWGGADGDYFKGGAGLDTAFTGSGFNNCSADVDHRNQCSGSAEEVITRNRSKIAVGAMPTNMIRGGMPWESFYVVGSGSTDRVSVKYADSGVPSHVTPSYVIFTAEAGSTEFDTDNSVDDGLCEYKATQVKCETGWGSSRVDAITMAGMAGDDTLSVSSEGTDLEVTATPVLLGGEGNDVLLGSGRTEDVLVDGEGTGNDALSGFGFDDALLNNDGTDNLQAGLGSDLLLSASICWGDNLQGSERKKGDRLDVNNASWSQLPAASGGVVADLKRGMAGSQFTSIQKPKGGDDGGKPSCASGGVDRLKNIDDLEGSGQADAFYGDPNDNNLLGRNGEDLLFARGGEDRVAAKDGESDKVGGGGGEDVCITDDGLDTVEGCEP